MKRVLPIAAILFAALITFKTNAQCNLKASIRASQPGFCPGGTDTLSTQIFDTYQWYRNNKVIPGATNRVLVIFQATDEGVSFRVRVTKGACADTAKNIVVTSYVFNKLTITASGDVGIFNPNKDAYIECPLDTLTLSIDSPYARKIQWYNSGKQILGAHGQGYNVTKSGNYAVCAAPNVCATYIVCDTAASDTSSVKVSFDNPKATITERHDTLFSSSAKKYQWYISNTKIVGATKSYYVPQRSGDYKVAIEDGSKCQAVSDPYTFTKDGLTTVSVSPNPVSNVMRVHITASDAKQIVIVDLYGNQKLKTAVTGSDQSISMQNINAGTYVLQVLNSKAQPIGSVTVIKQ